MNSRYIAVNVLTGQQSKPFEFRTLAALFILIQDYPHGWQVRQVLA